MDAISHPADPVHAGREANDHSRLRIDMEASAHALFVADNAQVHEAMNSVAWERRGFLQRLTRRAR
jgi:HD superfamily phosphohydrolase YqeK